MTLKLLQMACCRMAGDAVERTDRDSVAKRSLLQLDRLGKATVVGSVYGGAILPAVYQLAEGLLPVRTVLNVVLKTAISCGLLGGRQLLQPGRTTPARPPQAASVSSSVCSAASARCTASSPTSCSTA